MNVGILDSNRLKKMNDVGIPSRLVYIILHGLRLEGVVHADYNDIIIYSNMGLRTVTNSIKELIDKGYIARISRGKYTINK